MAEKQDPPQFDTDYTKDQIRYAPHLLFIKQAERVDEAMAAGRDPYPAYCAWQGALAAWAYKDPQFLKEAALLDMLLEDVYRLYGCIPRLEYVRAWRPLYFGVMRRARMFDILLPKVAASNQDLSTKIAIVDTTTAANPDLSKKIATAEDPTAPEGPP